MLTVSRIPLGPPLVATTEKGGKEVNDHLAKYGIFILTKLRTE
jgi:hypothetical protein